MRWMALAVARHKANVDKKIITCTSAAHLSHWCQIAKTCLLQGPISEGHAIDMILVPLHTESVAFPS